MDSHAIYTKTEKGQAEIKSRQYRLAPDLRHVLIMIDGRHSVAENRLRLKGFGDLDAVLTTLLELGFIEMTGSAQGHSRRLAPPPAIAEKKQQLSQLLYELLGPAADDWLLKIEAAPSLLALHKVLEECTSYLEKNTPIKKARAFWQQAEKVLNDENPS